MSSFFLTNPDSATGSPPRRRKVGYFEYKEAVENALIDLSVPFETSRVAVIDFKKFVGEGLQRRQSPHHTAVLLLEHMEKV